MTSSASHIPIHELGHGDWARILFDPPYQDEEVGPVEAATGEIITVVGQVYLASTDHGSSLGLPHLMRIDDHPGARAERLETRDARHARKARQARGEIIFPDPPRDAAEIQEQLFTLAEMIATAPSGGMHSRRDELKLQFDDVADLAQIARRKRTYILTRAIIGHDFHPWTTRDPRVYRIETERPLPSDFEPDKSRRKDRARRLGESIRIFGEAEREVRRYASRLRAAGYDVRRPHPNAQELLIRIRLSASMSADIALKASPNGLWALNAREAANKTQERARARLRREGHVASLRKRLGLE